MDYYRVLQIDPDAEPEVVERAYKALCFKYHPDRMPEDRRARATRRMQAINEAYAVLGDHRRRERYDRARTARPSGGAGWDVFWAEGLVGLFKDRYFPRS